LARLRGWLAADDLDDSSLAGVVAAFDHWAYRLAGNDEL
jgi:hypothetical protein